MRLCLVVIAVTLFLAGVKGQVPQYHYSNCARPGTYNQTGSGVTGPAPPLPVLPNTFQVRVEANILNKQMTVVATEYVDKPNNRAALRVVQNNRLDYMIFDDKNNQLIYDVSGNCYADTLSSDINRPMFGIKMSKNSSIPHIYSTTGALQFAVSNGLTYMGRTTVRGITVDHWLSCMYWPQMSANFTLDFYWSSSTWTDSVLYPQVPVRATVTGQALETDFKFHNFNHTYEYYDFRDHIWGDDSVFETPKGAVCKNRKQTRTVPQMTSQYSYREEIIDALQNSVGESDIWYDYPNKLIRYDFRNNNNRPSTEIHDYNTGIAYIIDRVNGNCSVSAIGNFTLGSSTNVTIDTNGRSEYTLQLQSPSSFFYLDNTTYTYEGKRTVRGMKCDVFISRRTDFALPGVQKFNSTLEFYFLDPVWSAVNNVGRNVSHTADIPISLDITTPAWAGFNTSYNFYNFNEEELSLSNFNIKSCFDALSQKSFMITFPISVGIDSALLAYKPNFLKATMETLNRISHVEQIRFQSPEFHMDADKMYFLGQLMDLPPSTAYFQKSTSKYQHFNTEKNYPAASPNRCADLCSNGTSLSGCNSFNYCAARKLCFLSPYHAEDGQYADTSKQCDHYSRTTGTADYQVSMKKAWMIIRNSVYSGKFKIRVNIGQGVIKSYTAQSVTDKVILNGQRKPTSQAALSNFNMQANKAIPHYDDLIILGLAVDDCAAECINRQAWVCNSFEYKYNTGWCTLSKLHPDQRPGSVVNAVFTDLYSRKYTAQYQKIPGITLLSQSQAIYENIYTADMCAKLCSNYNGFNCLSFDYCDDLSTCYLGKMHYYDAPKANIHAAPSCNHYSRNYLYDFKRYSMKKFANVADRVITGVSLSQCAKLCVQQESINCAGFDYCNNVTTCRLTTASMKNAGQMTLTANLWCYVYKRQTLPDGTPYVNKPHQCHTTPVPSDNNNATTAASNSNNSTTTSRSSNSNNSTTTPTSSNSNNSTTTPTSSNSNNSTTTPTSSNSNNSITTSSNSIYSASTPSSSILYTTSTSISVNYSSLPFNSGNKYSGGAMAGIAFGMLIAGILLTVGAFFLLARFRGKQHADSMKMGFVKEEERVYDYVK